MLNVMPELDLGRGLIALPPWLRGGRAADALPAPCCEDSAMAQCVGVVGLAVGVNRCDGLVVRGALRRSLRPSTAPIRGDGEPPASSLMHGQPRRGPPPLRVERSGRTREAVGREPAEGFQTDRCKEDVFVAAPLGGKSM